MGREGVNKDAQGKTGQKKKNFNIKEKRQKPSPDHPRGAK